MIRPMHARGRAGLTLIELTVGIVVTGLVIMAGYAAFSSVIDGRADGARAAAQTSQIAGVRRTLLRWLDGATAQIPQDLSDPQTLRQVQVITRAETPMHSAQTTVRLFIDDGSTGMGRGLSAIMRPDAGNDSLYVALDPWARAMQVQYLVNGDGLLQWVTIDGVGQMTPLAVRLQVASDDPTMALAFAQPIEAPLLAAR
jgi:hypothetical protein